METINKSIRLAAPLVKQVQDYAKASHISFSAMTNLLLSRAVADYQVELKRMNENK